MPVCKACGIEKEDKFFPKKSKTRCNSCLHKHYYKPTIIHKTEEEKILHKRQVEKDRYARIRLDPVLSPTAVRKRNPELFLFRQARSRAKQKSVPFDIEIEDIYIPEKCPIFGFNLTMNEGGVKHDSMSLDRIIPELGYVKGNVRVISWLANAMKSNATEDLLITFAEWVLANHKKD